MVVDVGVVKNYIKPKAYLTLYNMRKADLIEYIRTLEHNYNVAVSFNENQAKYIESLGFNGVVLCKDCKYLENHCKCRVPLGAGLCNDQEYILVDGESDFCSYGERRKNE